MTHFRGGVIAVMASCMLVAGCVSPRGAQPPSPAAAITLAGPLADGAAVRPDPPPPKWWHLYREPALDALVEEALKNNRDLRAAAAHLLQARAIVQQAGAALWPATVLAAGAGEGSTIQDQIAAAAGKDGIRTGTRYDLGAGVAWELDLSGRQHSALRSAQADARAAAALEDGVRVAVAAGVTGAWLEACGYAHQAQVARESLALAQRGREVAERLQAAGSALPVEVLRAGTLVAQASAALPLLEAKRHAALAELAVLTGSAPDHLSPAASACQQLPPLPASLPTADAVTLLRRRPDVRAAEQKLAAGTARVGVAVAELYPRISLSSEAALSSPTIGGLGARDNWVWRVGPLLNWSFPNLSAARARVRYARAAEVAALADFDAAILTAMKEVNETAAACAAALNRQQELRAAAGLAARADRLLQMQRAAGAATALEALDAERADIQAQAMLAAADSDVASAQVALLQALGGGWEDAPAVVLPALLGTVENR